ncbi:MAG: hypothetical protein AAFR61_16560, partial [Bacteroidota bacterium]
MKHPIHKLFRRAALSLTLLVFGALQMVEAKPQRAPQKIQVALIIDGSKSMDEWLEAAKAEFWYMVDGLLMPYENANDYAAQPILEVAMIEYGQKKWRRKNRFMNVSVPFTPNLDRVSEALYRVRPRGSREFTGEAIELAMDELRWSRDRDDIKLIYVIGNQSIRKGRTDFVSAVKSAKRQDIEVHTVFCGTYGEGVRKGWRKASKKGNGTYTALEDPSVRSYRPTQYDDRVISLNDTWNDTYIPYGPNGSVYLDQMYAQDRWIRGYGSGPWVSRIIVKTRNPYSCVEWDLVSAWAYGYVDIRTMPIGYFPGYMRGMTFFEREAYLRTRWRSRLNIIDEVCTYRGGGWNNGYYGGWNNGGGGFAGAVRQPAQREYAQRIPAPSRRQLGEDRISANPRLRAGSQINTSRQLVGKPTRQAGGEVRTNSQRSVSSPTPRTGSSRVLAPTGSRQAQPARSSSGRVETPARQTNPQREIRRPRELEQA